MQETTYRVNGEVRKITEIFALPEGSAQEHQSALRTRYLAAVDRVFQEGGKLESIRQGKIGRNDPCPCGSGRKFKRCCSIKLAMEIQTNGH